MQVCRVLFQRSGVEARTVSIAIREKLVVVSPESVVAAHLGRALGALGRNLGVLVNAAERKLAIHELGLAGIDYSLTICGSVSV